jgi:hypothetical protein
MVHLDDNPRIAASLSDGEKRVAADKLNSDEVCPGRVEGRMLIL